MSEVKTKRPGDDLSLAAFYNAVMEPRGFQLAPHHTVICNGLDDERIEKLMFLGPPGTGKSTLLGIAYPCYRLGRDPAKTILGISAGEKLIGTFISAASQIIQHSPIYERLFPDVRPDFNTGWSSDRGLFVTGRPIGDQDASYFAAGLSSKALTGVHAREIILDDPHDKTNSITPSGREGVIETYYNTIIGRGDPRGVRMVLAGRRWSSDDLYGHLAREGDWVVMHVPADRPDSKLLWYDVLVPDGLKCVFSETLKESPHQDKGSRYKRYRAYYGVDPTGKGFYWPTSPSKRKEAESVRRGSPKQYEIIYNGNEAAAEGGVFEKEDFRAYAPPTDLNMGLQSIEVKQFIATAKGRVVSAWDTAFGQDQSESKTANLVGLLVPCKHWHCGEETAVHGPAEFHYDVYLLDRILENIRTDKLIMKVRTQHRKWNANPEIVEQKASGISIIQTLKHSEIPIKAYMVQEGKIARAVNGVGGGPCSVQGWARMGRVHYPAGMPWIDDFLNNVTRFSGDRDSRSDDFDALVHLVTYAIELSSKSTIIPNQDLITFDTSRSLLPGMSSIIDRNGNNLNTLSYFGSLSLDKDTLRQLNPYVGLCGAPCWAYTQHNHSEYCTLLKKKVSAIDGCSRWSLTAPDSFATVGDTIHG